MPARVQVAPSLALEKQDSEREFADRLGRIDCGDGLETLTVTRRSQSSINRKLEAEDSQPGQRATRHGPNAWKSLTVLNSKARDFIRHSFRAWPRAGPP